VAHYSDRRSSARRRGSAAIATQDSIADKPDLQTPCTLRISGTLTIQETAGIGGNVDSITSGNTNIGANEIIQRSGTNHVAARIFWLRAQLSK